MIDVCVGVVLYNPQIERLRESLGVFISTAGKIILIDNASANINEVETLSKEFGNVVLLRNKENLGIATALNQICFYASDHNYGWALTMDQDTICPTDIIQKLSKYSNIDKVGILCPVVDYEGLNISQKINKGELTEAYACMTSGSLTNLKAWSDVGGFRDDYFIDFVDNEFCRKLQINHYKILRVNDCIMHHQLGKAKEKRIFGLFKRKVCIHSPLRYYYMTRNNLLFIWEYSKHLNILKEYLKIASILWNGILYADEKVSTIKYIYRGLNDARHGITGRYTERKERVFIDSYTN